MSMIIEVSTTQYSGKKYSTQQDALYDGITCIQKSDSPAQTYISERDVINIAVADGVLVSPFPHLASKFVVEQLSRVTESGSELDAKLIRLIHGMLYYKDSHGRQ